MVKRRTPNPAKMKVDYTALMTPEATRPHWLRRMAPWLIGPALAGVGVVLLLLSFAPFDQWLLAYVALVPWTLALVVTPSRRYALLVAYLSGLAFWVAGVYWIWWITIVGYIALTAFLGLFFMTAGALLRATLARGLPAFLMLPIVWVSLEFLRIYMISGFPWFFLSHSQYRNTQLIQVVDVLGELGPSVFVAMVNGALVDLLLWWRSRSGLKGGMTLPPPVGGLFHRLAGLTSCAVMLAAMLIYGHVRLNQQAQAPGPVVGVVQQSYPIYLEGNNAADGPSGDKIFREHLAATTAMKDAGVQLVIWPESMAVPLINPYFLNMDFEAMTRHERRAMASATFGPSAWDRKKFSDDEILYILHWQREINTRYSFEGDRHQGSRYYARELAKTSRDMDASLLIGSSSLQPNPQPLDDKDIYVRLNSVLLFDHDEIAKGEYSKIHLVPFGEYVPFKHGWPWLHKALRSFVPEEMPQLEPGARISRFDVTVPAAAGAATVPTTGPAPARTIRIAAPICYEGVFARECRALVMQDGTKAADMIVNMSNDGWFVHQDGDGQWLGTTEQAQHLAQYVFRAIESRVPVVRSVNTGISAYVDSNGRIRAQVSRYGKSVMVSGTLVLDGQMKNDNEYLDGHGPRVELDSRVSVYSVVGDVFGLLISAACVAMAAWLAWSTIKTIRSRRSNKAALKGK